MKFSTKFHISIQWHHISISVQVHEEVKKKSFSLTSFCLPNIHFDSFYFVAFWCFVWCEKSVRFLYRIVILWWCLIERQRQCRWSFVFIHILNWKYFMVLMWKCAFHLHIAAILCKSFCLNAFSLLQYHSTMLVLYCKVNIKMKAKRINENFEVKTTLPFINSMAFMLNNWSNFMKCGYRRRRNSSMHNNIYIKI